jgi:hypothetical protein
MKKNHKNNIVCVLFPFVICLTMTTVIVPNQSYVLPNNAITNSQNSNMASSPFENTVGAAQFNFNPFQGFNFNLGQQQQNF